MEDIERLKDAINGAKLRKDQLKNKLTINKNAGEKKNIREEINELERNEILRTNDFVTVMAGAHEGHMPVIRMNSGLPPHFTSIDEFKELARKKVTLDFFTIEGRYILIFS